MRAQMRWSSNQVPHGDVIAGAQGRFWHHPEVFGAAAILSGFEGTSAAPARWQACGLVTHICLRQFVSASAYHSHLRHSRAEIGYRSHDGYSGWIMKPARGKWTTTSPTRGSLRAIEMLSADSPTSSPLTGTLPGARPARWRGLLLPQDREDAGYGGATLVAIDDEVIE